MKTSSDTKFVIAVIAVIIAIIAGGIFFFSRPPKVVPTSSLLTEEVATLGNTNSKIELVEFSDFECPACLGAKPIVDKLLEKYSDKIVFGYRHFPLPQHEFAFDAALASEAAHEQGKFWEMHEYLFTNQETLSKVLIAESGKSIGLDDKIFQESLKSSKVRDKVLNDMTTAKKRGVRSTPTFFLNGVKLELRSFSELDMLIQEAIDK